jgi:hypothetical protein
MEMGISITQITEKYLLITLTILFQPRIRNIPAKSRKIKVEIKNTLPATVGKA